MNFRSLVRCGAVCAALLFPTFAHAFADLNAGLEAVSSSAAAWGDYDRDSDFDLVLAGTTTSGVRITRIYRQSFGTFFDVGAGLTGVSDGSVDWGDYDNDGDLDLLVTGHDGSTPVSIVYRNDAGTFVDAGANLDGVYRSDADWGDYDDDGDLDILLSGFDSTDIEVTNLYRNDSGSFSFVLTNLEQVEGSAVAWADYDNDGDLDIALAGFGQTGRETYVYRNDAGVFTDIVAGIEGIVDGSVDWGDYDADGDFDLLVTGQINGGGAGAFVYRNTGGSFTDVGAGISGLLFSDADWGDFDGDGDLDILHSGFDGGQARTRLYRNDAGTFVNAGASLPGVTGGSVHWGDYDSEGRLDILITGMGSTPIARIYESTLTSTNPPPSPPGSLNVTVTAGIATFSWTPSSDLGAPAAGLSYNLRVGTTPGGNELLASMSVDDGRRQLPRIGNRGKRRSWQLDVSAYTGQVIYWSAQAIDAGYAASFFAPEAELALQVFEETATALVGVSNSAVAWGDYDADGDLDVVLSGQAATGRRTDIYRNDAGVFTDIGAGLEPVTSSALDWGDYDRDGDLDLLLAGESATGAISVVYRNDNGVFTDIGAGLEGVSDGAVRWGDYNNDGDLDIVIAGWNGTSASTILYRNVYGHFTDTGAGLLGVSSCDLDWGDYDDDGDLDLVLAGNTGSERAGRVYRNDAGRLQALQFQIAPVDECSVAWADFDGDGFLDVFVSGNRGPSPYARLYSGPDLDGSSGRILPLERCSIAVGDHDNDGDPDIVITGVDGTGTDRALVYRNNGRGFFDPTEADLQPVRDGAVAWGDVDDDGDLDLLLTGMTDSGALTPLYVNAGVPVNDRPQPPFSLFAYEESGRTVFDWSPGFDAETPVDGLSYNLRIGTTPGGNEVMSAMANAAGILLLPDLGNAQQSLQWSMDLYSFNGQTVYWSVQTIDAGMLGSEFSFEATLDVIATSAPELPATSALAQNQPNPFNPSTEISFELSSSGPVRLEIFDVRGALIRTLQAGAMPAGRHVLHWDGRDDAGHGVASGVYVYQLQAGEMRASRRMTLLK